MSHSNRALSNPAENGTSKPAIAESARTGKPAASWLTHVEGFMSALTANDRLAHESVAQAMSSVRAVANPPSAAPEPASSGTASVLGRLFQTVKGRAEPVSNRANRAPH